MKNLNVEKEPSVNFGDVSLLIHVTEKIIHRHQEMGPSSPLNPGQIADLNYKIGYAKVKHEEGLKYQRLMLNSWAERDKLLGTQEDEPGTLTQNVQNICRMLADIYQEDRKELDKWF